MANGIDYFEIGTPDPEGTKQFYGEVFGWKMGAANPQSGYSAIDDDRGGVWDTSKMGGAHWGIFYVHVDDVKATITKAEQKGGKVVVPYNDEGDIEFVHFEDHPTAAPSTP